MLTVSQLAKHAGISRTTILYYERVGLLKPASRTSKGYRMYGTHEIKRLEAIRAYRSYGLSVQQIPDLLDKDDGLKQEQILVNQFQKLEEEIQCLRVQQNNMLKLLKNPLLLQESKMTKEKWTEIMLMAGLSEDDMCCWHKKFEELEPKAHREFLKSLNIENADINKICEWSRK